MINILSHTQQRLKLHTHTTVRCPLRQTKGNGLIWRRERGEEGGVTNVCDVCVWVVNVMCGKGIEGVGGGVVCDVIVCGRLDIYQK